MMTTLEREYQEQLDTSRVEETFVCDSCENELALEERCDHDPKTIHNWCLGCCEEFGDNTPSPMQWDDLD